MFFNKTNTQPAQNSKSPQAPRRSILNILFNPRIGDSIKPIGESFDVFVNLIAMVFAMNGLFPRNHPALQNQPNARLTMGEVFRTAWSGLEFTKDGVPKVVLFFAVVGMIAGTGIGLLLTILTLFMGQAHAATSYFTSPNPSTDVALNIVNFLFGSSSESSAAYTALDSIVSAKSPGAHMPSTPIQGPLQAALGMYSNAMLIFAGIILFYHLAKMVVNTAHEGVVMGKNANQIWAPIRLVFAIILLVPVSSGLNTGQYIVIKMAEWGSGLASNVWQQFSNNMYGNATFAAARAPDVTNVTTAIAAMSACTYVDSYYRKSVATASGNAALFPASQYVNSWIWSDGATPTAPSTFDTTQAGTTYHFQADERGSNLTDLCGSYTVPAAPTGAGPLSAAILTGIYDAHRSSFLSMLPSALQYGAEAKNGIQELTPGDITKNTGLQGIIASYQNDIKSKILALTNDKSINVPDDFSAYGWMSAGAMFAKFSLIQGQIEAASQNYLPKVQLPNIDALLGDCGHSELMMDCNAPDKDARKKIDAYNSFAQRLNRYVSETPSGTAPSFSQMIANMKLSSPVDTIFAVVDYLAASQGVWEQTTSSNFSLGVKFTSSNPLAELASFGHKNVNLAYSLFDKGIWFMAGGIAGTALGKLPIVGTFLKPVTSIIGGASFFIGALLLPIGVIFFTMGLVMGFVLPLMPFMTFFFSCMVWLTILVEAIIAVPLIALAHINPEGEGLPGSQAKAGYTMVFSLLLRPVLVVFGLIAAYLLFTIGAGLLNLFFVSAVANSAGADQVGGHYVMMRIIYTILYCLTLMTIANNLFRLVEHVPDKAMGWISAQGAPGVEIGNAGTLENKVALAAGYMGTKAASQATVTGNQLKALATPKEKK